MRYLIFIFLFQFAICELRSQNVTQPGLREWQISGGALYDSVLYILGTDTLDGSKYQGLGKFHRADTLRNWFKDTDWLKYRTGRTPNNTDTAYHVGIASVGTDSVFSGKLNVLGRLDLRYPDWDNSNIAIGNGAINSTSTGNIFNVAIGINALYNASGVQYSFAIGDSALYSATTGDFNMALGSLALKNLTTGSSNTAVGQSSLYTSASLFNTAIGRRSGFGGATNYNTLIGYDAGYGGVTSNNVIIGAEAGRSTPISNNVFLGYQAGRLNTGSGNIFIGKESGENETGSDKLYIDNSNTSTPLIHGDFSSDTLRINGDLSIRDAVSGASTDSVLVWTASTGRVKMRNASAFSGSSSDHDWYEVGGTSPPNDITDAMFHTGDVAIGQTTTTADYRLTIKPSASTHGAIVENSSLEYYPLSMRYNSTKDWSLWISDLAELYVMNNGATTTIPFVIEEQSPTNTVVLESDGDVKFADYPNSRDDGSPTNVLGTNASGVLQSYPAADLLFMYNWNLAASGTVGTEAITDNETVTISETTGLDVTRSTNTVSVALSIDEFSTDATIEEDELLLAYDPSGTNHELIDVNNLPYLDAEVDGSTTNELNTIEEGNVSVQTSNTTIDFQTLFDVAADGAGEVNVSMDLSEATIDAATEGDEYVIIYDPSSGAHERVLVTSVSGGFDGNGIFDAGNDGADIGNTTFDVGLSPGGVAGYINFESGDFYVNASTERVGMGTASPGYGLHVLRDAGAAIESETAGTGGLVLKLEGKADGGGAKTDEAGILWNYTDADYLAGAEQQAASMILHKESDAAQWSTLKLQMNENTDAGIVYEKNADFTNTTESHLAINGGIAYTQNYDGSTAGADLSLDRSYYTVNITGGNLTDTIKLPEVASTTDNWTSSLTSTQCQVGQEYVVTNARSGVNLVIGAYNPAGTSDDLIGTRTAPGGSAGSAISLAPGKSAIIKCYQLAGGIGYWNYWLSN